MALDDQAQIESLVVDLTREFENAVGSDKIRDEVMSVYQRFRQGTDPAVRTGPHP